MLAAHHRSAAAGGLAGAVVMVVLALALAGCSGGSSSAAPAGASTSPIIGAYPGGNTIGAELRVTTKGASDYGHIDTPRTIAQLKRLHATTYFYLVWHARTDWSDFVTTFLPAAQKAGIKVWVYLVPPSECTAKYCSYPYKTDYAAWAQAVARQSLRHSALQGWVLDDFYIQSNRSKLTPTYLMSARKAGTRIAPRLKFMTLLYYADITPAFFAQYGKAIDGVVFAFSDDPYTNTQWTGTLKSQLDVALSVTSAVHVPLVLMLYAERLQGSELLPDADYVTTLLRTAAPYLRSGGVRGVVAYGAPLAEPPADPGENHAHAGIGCLSLIASRHSLTAGGDFAAAQQRIRLNTSATHSFTFEYTDRTPLDIRPAGRRLQVLVNGTTVFDHSLSVDPTNTWVRETVDLGSSVDGGTSADLRIQLMDTKPVSHVPNEIDVDQIQPTGFTLANGGFEQRGSWGLTRRTGTFLPAIDLYDARRSTHVFNAIAAVYATYAGKP